MDLTTLHGKNWSVFLDFISTITIIMNLVAMASASDSEDELCLLYQLIELETTIRMVVLLSLSILVNIRVGARSTFIRILRGRFS